MILLLFIGGGIALGLAGMGAAAGVRALFARTPLGPRLFYGAEDLSFALPGAVLCALLSQQNHPQAAYGLALGGALFAVCLVGGLCLLRAGQKVSLEEIHPQTFALLCVLLVILLSTLFFGRIPLGVGIALIGAYLMRLGLPGIDEGEPSASGMTPPLAAATLLASLLLIPPACASLMAGYAGFVRMGAYLHPVHMALLPALLHIPLFIRVLFSASGKRAGQALHLILLRAFAGVTLYLGLAALFRPVPVRPAAVPEEITLALLGAALLSVPTLLSGRTRRVQAFVLLGMYAGFAYALFFG